MGGPATRTSPDDPDDTDVPREVIDDIASSTVVD
jgi:hypothetical protein